VEWNLDAEQEFAGDVEGESHVETSTPDKLDRWAFEGKTLQSFF